MGKAKYLNLCLATTLFCSSFLLAETEVPTTALDAKNAFYQAKNYHTNQRKIHRHIRSIIFQGITNIINQIHDSIENGTIPDYTYNPTTDNNSFFLPRIKSLKPNPQKDKTTKKTNDNSEEENIIIKDSNTSEKISNSIGISNNPNEDDKKNSIIANSNIKNENEENDDDEEIEEYNESEESDNPEANDPENSDDDSDNTDGNNISDTDDDSDDDDDDDSNNDDGDDTDANDENNGIENEENQDEVNNSSTTNNNSDDEESSTTAVTGAKNISGDESSENVIYSNPGTDLTKISSTGSTNTSLFDSVGGLTLEKPEDDEDDDSELVSAVPLEPEKVSYPEEPKEKIATSTKKVTKEKKQPAKKNTNKTYNILMVGNSKTYYNNLATMFEKLVNRAKKEGKVDFKVNVEQFSFNKAAGKNDYTAGLELKQIYKMRNSKILAKLKSKKWDYIILEPGSAEEFKEKQMTWDLNTYYQIAKKKNPDLKVILYMSQLNMGKYNTSYPAKVNKIAEAAVEKCKIPQKNVRIAYAYSAYKEYHKHHNEWSKLYQKDKLHSSVEGSYLIACVLYSTLTGKSPVGIGYTGGVSKKDITTNKKDLSGKNGTWYCHSPVHKGVSNSKQYQEYAWTVEKNKSKFSVK